MDKADAALERIEELEKCLKDTLERLLMRDNGITDVVWFSDHTTLAEHIASHINEDIDFQEIAEAVQDRKIEYRCPKTQDFEVISLKKVLADSFELLRKGEAINRGGKYFAVKYTDWLKAMEIMGQSLPKGGKK